MGEYLISTVSAVVRWERSWLGCCVEKRIVFDLQTCFVVQCSMIASSGFQMKSYFIQCCSLVTQLPFSFVLDLMEGCECFKYSGLAEADFLLPHSN